MPWVITDIGTTPDELAKENAIKTSAKAGHALGRVTRRLDTGAASFHTAELDGRAGIHAKDVYTVNAIGTAAPVAPTIAAAN